MLALMASARREVLLVAPFMTAGATARVLAAAPADVDRVTLVTRWRPEEVAAGVSDLDVFDIVQDRRGATLLLHPRLHAKYFRADDTVLVGSANLTDTALGWAAVPNLEILVPHPDEEAARAFEADLMSEAYPATAEIREVVRMHIPDDASPPGVRRPWLPRCASPQDLWKVYTGSGLADVLDTSRRDGEADLVALGLPDGIDERAFRSVVGRRFLEMPLVARTIERMGSGISDDEGPGLLSSGVPAECLPHGQPSTAWLILKRWLTIFGGGEFRSKPTGEVLVRGRVR